MFPHTHQWSYSSQCLVMHYGDRCTFNDGKPMTCAICGQVQATETPNLILTDSYVPNPPQNTP